MNINTGTQISILPVGELYGMHFAIPDYQRGYRWEARQVKDLLKDIDEFIESGTDGIYCLQPLVVKKRDTAWEVIDGQQRLTTTSIILQVLGETPVTAECAETERKNHVFRLSYDAIEGSGQFINNICEPSQADKQDDNINFHYMFGSYSVAEQWFRNKPEEYRQTFKETLKSRVKFIWYQTEDDRPIEVFSRLNIGRISLTSSELIKAIFLNRQNFAGIEVYDIQHRIAQQWDEMENHLQNDEFWYFLLSKQECDAWDKPTRIDFLFDFLCVNQDYIEYDADEVGDDQFRTFRCFYDYYSNHRDSFLKAWDNIVKPLFDTFKEWFENYQLYHLVGYVICVMQKEFIRNRYTRHNIYEEWRKRDKASFMEDYLIKDLILGRCLLHADDLNHDYSQPRDHKTETRRLLLLHNIMMVMKQNHLMEEKSEYGHMGMFYRFPFNLFKMEKWEVEHIDSNTTNTQDHEDWVLHSWMCLNEEQKENTELKALLEQFFEGENGSQVFEPLQEMMTKMLNWKPDSNHESWKNQIKNFTLLDKITNCTYQNDIFPVKRLFIVSKEKGVFIEPKWDKEKKEVTAVEVPQKYKSSFVPPCTKNVFQKTWSTGIGNITQWTEADADAYLNEIKLSLEQLKTEKYNYGK